MTISFRYELDPVGSDPGRRIFHRPATGSGGVSKVPMPPEEPVPLGFYRRGDMPFPPLELVPSLAPTSIIASIDGMVCMGLMAPCSTCIHVLGRITSLEDLRLQ